MFLKNYIDMISDSANKEKMSFPSRPPFRIERRRNLDRFSFMRKHCERHSNIFCERKFGDIELTIKIYYY